MVLFRDTLAYVINTPYVMVKNMYNYIQPKVRCPDVIKKSYIYLFRYKTYSNECEQLAKYKGVLKNQYIETGYKNKEYFYLEAMYKYTNFNIEKLTEAKNTLEALNIKICGEEKEKLLTKFNMTINELTQNNIEIKNTIEIKRSVEVQGLKTQHLIINDIEQRMGRERENHLMTSERQRQQLACYEAQNFELLQKNTKLTELITLEKNKIENIQKQLDTHTKVVAELTIKLENSSKSAKETETLLRAKESNITALDYKYQQLEIEKKSLIEQVELLQTKSILKEKENENIIKAQNIRQANSEQYKNNLEEEIRSIKASQEQINKEYNNLQGKYNFFLLLSKESSNQKHIENVIKIREELTIVLKHVEKYSKTYLTKITQIHDHYTTLVDTQKKHYDLIKNQSTLTTTFADTKAELLREKQNIKLNKELENAVEWNMEKKERLKSESKTLINNISTNVTEQEEQIRVITHLEKKIYDLQKEWALTQQEYYKHLHEAREFLERLNNMVPDKIISLEDTTMSLKKNKTENLHTSKQRRSKEEETTAAFDATDKYKLSEHVTERFKNILLNFDKNFSTQTVTNNNNFIKNTESSTSNLDVD